MPIRLVRMLIRYASHVEPRPGSLGIVARRRKKNSNHDAEVAPSSRKNEGRSQLIHSSGRTRATSEHYGRNWQIEQPTRHGRGYWVPGLSSSVKSMSAQSDDEGRPSSLSTGNHKHRYGFMPTRDLPQLKPTPSLAAVKHGLGALASAMGLGRTQEIYLSEASLPEVARNGDAIAADLSDDEPQRCVETEVESRFAQSWLTRIISSSSFADEPDIVDRAAEILAGLCGKSGEVRPLRFQW